MDWFFGIGNTCIGILMILIGFKVYNPFKGKNEAEKEAKWYKKFGTYFKIGGIGMVILGAFQILNPQ